MLIDDDATSTSTKPKSTINPFQAPVAVVPSDTTLTNDSLTLNAPNLLTKLPHLGSLVALSEIRKPDDRLLLLGGASGFLREMEKARVTPDIKTFTQLIDVIPPTHAAEKMVIATIRKLGIKCDIDFFNMLIKKRSMRYEYESAKVRIY